MLLLQKLSLSKKIEMTLQKRLNIKIIARPSELMKKLMLIKITQVETAMDIILQKSEFVL